MKKERSSFFILFVEIAAIILLHSAKSHHIQDNKPVSERKATIAAPQYQIKSLSFSKLNK